MHLDEDQVQRLLHDGLSDAGASHARAHIAHCAACRAAIAAAEREAGEVRALLHHLDHPPPSTGVGTLMALARGRARSRVRWAAGIVGVALGLAGAAYAAPGSPLRAWVRTVLGDGRPVRPDPGPAGIAVAPGPRLVIAFTARQSEGRVVVNLSDGGDVVARAPAGAATFTSHADRLVIGNAGSSADFVIEIPRDAPLVEILVAGARVFLKDGASADGVPPARCELVAAGQFSCPLTPASASRSRSSAPGGPPPR